MGSTLEHGIYLPSEGEKNCYQGLAGNWNKVDGALGDVAELKQLIENKFTKEIVTELPTEDINPYCIYLILKTDPETDNIYDEWVYINNAWEYLGNTQVDMTQYYTKQEVNQLPAVASGVTSTKVGNYDAHIANGEIHVTASDKAKWDTVALIKQLRLVNTQVGSATTIAFANIDDTNGIKVGDKCMDLDGKMFEITAVDATNETVTVGSALIDLALDANVVHTAEINSSGIGIIEAVKEVGGVDFNTLTTQGLYGANASDSTNNPENSPCVVQVIKRLNSVIQIANISSSAYKSRYIRYCADITAQPPVWQSWIKFATDDNVMHLSGNETAAGKKTFSEYITSDGSTTGDEYSSNAKTNLWLMSNRDTEEVSGVLFDTYRQNTAQGTGIHVIGLSIKENSVRYEGCRWGWYWDNNLNGYTFDFKPTTQGVNQAVKHNLGTSIDKWDTINGINPGALSLPDLDNGIDISGYITVNGGENKESLYTPPVNGWISVRLSRRTSGSIAVLLIQGGMASSGRDTTNESGVKTADAILPVVGGVQVSINSALADSVVSAYFYPCLGNV